MRKFIDKTLDIIYIALITVVFIAAASLLVAYSPDGTEKPPTKVIGGN